MADIRGIGNAIAGMGAGFMGRGAEWNYYQDQARMQAQEMEEARRQQQIQEVAAQNREFLSNLQAGRMDQALRVAVDGRQWAMQNGLPTNTWDERLMRGFKGGEVQWMLDDALSDDVGFVSRGYLKEMGGGENQTPADLLVFNELTRIASDPNEPPERREAAKIKLGQVARAGMSADERIAQDPALAQMIADYKAGSAAAVETAKQGVQLQTAPAIREAIAMAESRAKSAAEQAALDKSNDSTFLVYEAAMTGLAQALDNTLTGPFVGMIPAVTSNQQIANGAIAATAPVLKQLFRATGEGQFTDKDQELLLDMVPKRSDSPEARASKLQNIDAIIRAKLGQPLSGGANAPRSRESVLSQYGVGG